MNPQETAHLDFRVSTEMFDLSALPALER